jgi:hypothetical protein
LHAAFTYQDSWFRLCTHAAHERATMGIRMYVLCRRRLEFRQTPGEGKFPRPQKEHTIQY